MKYSGIYSCGHEGIVDVFGPTKTHQWKVDKSFSERLCPNCYKKQIEAERAAKNEAAEREAKEMDLPELSGTPKQIPWANTIRVDFIKAVDDELSNAIKNNEDTDIMFFWEITLPDLEKIKDVLIQKTEARFWINKRDWSAGKLIRETRDELKLKEEIEKKEAALTVEPENREKDGIVSLVLKDGRIEAVYPKDDDFRKIVKSFGYTWDTVWNKEITEFSGPEEDRVAELGSALLANGFTVRFPDKVSMDMAVSGSFNCECRRWIKYNCTKQKLAICWDGYNNDLYQAARKLSGAKWNQDTGSMFVPVEFYNEVLDFAEIMGFRFSKRAVGEIEAFKGKAAGFMKANVKEVV